MRNRAENRNCSPQYGAVGQGDGVAVEVDGATVGQAGDGAVTGQRPGAAAFNGDHGVITERRAALGVVHDVDGAGEAAAVLQCHVQGGDGVHHDVAGQGLAVGGELHLCAVAAGGAPAVAGGVTHHTQQRAVGVLIFDGDAVEGQHAVGIGDVDHVAVLGGQRAAGHGEGGGAHIRVAAHGLIDHHIVDVLLGAAALGVAHIAGNVAVLQRDAVLALNHQLLGVVGGEDGVLHGNVGGGVHGGRVVAVGGIAAAVHIDGATAPVGADGRRGIAGGTDHQIGGVGGAAAGGLDAAGVVGGGGDHGFRDVDGGAAAVAEHAVAVLG